MNLAFAYPAFLWGLGALAIPVIIHLFHFRRTKTVYFSDVRLLRVTMQSTRRQREVRHLLILAARMLFLFFLVMAFAQPFIPARDQQGAGKHVVLYLDNSLSMSVPMQDNQRALDQATASVQALLLQYPADTRYRLITNDNVGGQTYRTADQIREQLSSVRLASSPRNLSEIRRKAADAFRPEIFFISDFQRSAFPDMEKELATDTTLTWSLLPVLPQINSNIYIDSAAFENPYLIQGELSRLNVWIRNTGDQSSDHVNLRLTIGPAGGPSRLAAASTVSIPAHGVEMVQFDVTAGRNPMVLEVSLQDFPVTYDNTFFITYMPLRKLNVVYISGGDRSTYLTQVFGNRELFDFTSFSAKRIGYDRMESADVVILDGLVSDDPALMAFDATHPGVVWLLVPPVWKGNPKDLSVVHAFTGLPVQVAAQGSPKGAKPVRESLAPADVRDPFFREVFEEGERQGSPVRMPEAVPVYSWGADRSALLRFRDGTPFLSRVKNKFLLAGPLHPEWTDLGNHALFVPLMYRLAATARKSDYRLFYRPDASTLVFPSDSAVSETPIRLSGPREAVAAQRQVNGEMRLDLSGLDLIPGIYSALRGMDTVAVMAVNPLPGESMVETYAVSELEEWAQKNPRIRIFNSSDLQAFRDEIKERYLGIPLWKFAALAALLFLLVEILLLRIPRFKAEQSAPQA